MSSDTRGLCTRTIHGTLSPDPATGAILTPIYQSTTYVQEAVGVHKGFTYSRAANPTVSALEDVLGSLEGAPTLCFSTGMAAITTLFLSILKQGDHAIISDVVYGGTVRLFRQVLEGVGVRASFVDTSNLSAVAAAIEPRTKLIFIETPANPTLKLTDIAAVSAIAREAGVLLAVDNTFLTAALQRVFELGADISVLSTTKYIEGHNATVGGSLATKDEALLERFRLVRKTIGCIQSPLESWLTQRGLKTLTMRLERHSQNALAVATWLENHPTVSRVFYPGLPSFPQHALACRQQAAHGGMLSFEVTGGTPAALELMKSVKLCSLAENLGAAETLITHPASMTHADIPLATREALGIPDGLIRLSVGLEDPADIIADLEQALRKAEASSQERSPAYAAAVSSRPRSRTPIRKGGSVMKIDTKLVQTAGCPGDPHRAVATPIYQTATFEQEGALEFSEYDYSRSGNPTRRVLEDQLAELEHGTRAFAFASGLAALTAVTRLLRPGDEILAVDDVYGGTCRLFSKILQRSEVAVRYVHGSTAEDFACGFTDHTRLIHIETPTNPLLTVVDIAGLAKLAHDHDALLCVDNTMLSPYLQNPLVLGADIVIHSATKALCGHSDVIAGAVIVRDEKLAEELYLIQNGEGAVLGPFDSYLLLRGIKTLSVRLDRQQENAAQIAAFLAEHPAVRRVYHPSLLDKRSLSIHSRQARGNGTVVSFETGSIETSRQIVEALKLFPITVSFGGLQSSVSLPGRMSHASVPAHVAAQRQLPVDLIRLSVGIEDAEDLIADLGDALELAEAVDELRASAG